MRKYLEFYDELERLVLKFTHETGLEIHRIEFEPVREFGSALPVFYRIEITLVKDDIKEKRDEFVAKAG